MAFYFRKLRTLRLMPTAKRSLGFGFSTRVNENEKERNVVNSENAYEQTLPSMHPVLPFDSEEGSVFGGHFNKEELKLFSSLKATSCLVPTIPPTSAIVPLTLDELKSLVEQKSSVVMKRCSSAVAQSSRSNKDIISDLLMESLRPVLTTSDDIHVDNPTHREALFCDRLPTDILTVHPWEDLGTMHRSTGTQGYFMSPSISAFDSFNLCFPGPFSFTTGVPTHCPKGTPHTSPSQTVCFSSPEGPGGGGDRGPSSSPKDGPSPEQVHDIREKLENSVINLFNSRHDYSILHKNVRFENNLFGKNQVSIGSSAYAFALLKMRFHVYARYSRTDMQILNVSTLENNGVVRIHWRLKGIPQSQLLMLQRLLRMDKDDVEWLEAFSYFHIGKDGLVHKHRIDRMLPDNERNTNKLTNKLQILLNPAKPLVS